MKMEEIPTFAGLGIHSERHIAALRSAPKHFTKERIQRATLLSGLTLEYAIVSSDNEAGTEDFPEERVVLITGYTMTKEGWAPSIDILLDKWNTKAHGRKLKILSFDNRGAGGSDAPFARYTTSAMAQDTVSLLDYVGWDSAHVVGGSMGGMIATELAATVPERVRSLSLLVTTRGAYLPHPRMWKPFLGAVLGSMQCAMELLYPSVILDNPIGGRDGLTVQDVLKAYHSTPQCENAFPPLHALVAQGVACLTHWVSDERLELVAKAGFPILIITGKQDIMIPPENSVTLVERLKGDHVHTLFFETGGHGAFFQFVEEIAVGLVQTIQRGSCKK
ncbi:alpha/beta hydrolase fold [Phytophthora infestans]|uniref:Alpha/beta hydrolase fold n=1 Tax=Phytophthora infestans TaxID=4787 RepID=A0A833TLI7_PHYIN|nr:alpha/beta hydrolase fold [Phytophthora infestans]KAF4132910.1 alpha/beta hydrolase fold [Phytophthora infestans]